MKISHFLTSGFVILLVSCTNSQSDTIKSTPTETSPNITPFHIYSGAFKEGENIPSIYTCDSSNISPQLHWNNPFKNAVSYALIMDDPDAPNGTWVHWVIYNIPATDTILNVHFPRDTLAPNGAREGITSFGAPGYGGPCPPDGEHRYYFKLYALDEMIPYPAGLKKFQLLGVMKGHILAEADLMGRYKRSKK
jgi:Raf kinase inhibitor-like YbhB/YbcL family protein